MQIFEKIIERLEKQKDFHCSDGDWDLANYGAYSDAIEIVNQVAEEYGEFEIFTKEQLASIEQMNINTFNRMVAMKHNGGGWIPCSERLPSDCAIHEVTAKFSNGKSYTEFAYYDETREEWWKFDDDGLVNVIAWKESSEPYKAESEE